VPDQPLPVCGAPAGGTYHLLFSVVLVKAFGDSSNKEKRTPDIH